jgi:hypothetical protein
MLLEGVQVFRGVVAPAAKEGVAWIDTSTDEPLLRIFTNTGWEEVMASKEELRELEERVNEQLETKVDKVASDTSIPVATSIDNNDGRNIKLVVTHDGGTRSQIRIGGDDGRLDMISLGILSDNDLQGISINSSGAYVSDSLLPQDTSKIVTEKTLAPKLDKKVDKSVTEASSGDTGEVINNGSTVELGNYVDGVGYAKINVGVGSGNTGISLYDGHTMPEGGKYAALFVEAEEGVSVMTGSDPIVISKVVTEASLQPLIDGKADKIEFAHVDWDKNNFNIPAGRAIQFDISKTPVLSGTGGDVIAFFSPVSGSISHLFGFYSDDAGVTTCAGTFHINPEGTEFTPDILVYDGTRWLNGGSLVLPYDLVGDLNEWIGIDTALAGFDASTDISIPDVATMNLVDVLEVAKEARGHALDALTEITQEAAARIDADAVEEAARANADNDLQSQVDAMQGQTRRFFIDFDTEFGTDVPTMAQTDAWLAARTPALTPNVGTAFKNSNTVQGTYNHLFVYYVDPADSDKLVLQDDGVDTVSTASASSLGVVRGAGDVTVDAQGDMYLGSKVVTDEKVADYTTPGTITVDDVIFLTSTNYSFLQFKDALVSKINGAISMAGLAVPRAKRRVPWLSTIDNNANDIRLQVNHDDKSDLARIWMTTTDNNEKSGFLYLKAGAQGTTSNNQTTMQLSSRAASILLLTSDGDSRLNFWPGQVVLRTSTGTLAADLTLAMGSFSFMLSDTSISASSSLSLMLNGNLEVNGTPVVLQSTPVNNSTGKSAIIVEPTAVGSYNEGIRLNWATNWSGIIIGGRPGTTGGVDAEGYAADQSDPATRCATWWIASNPGGDLVLQQVATSTESLPKGLYVKRTGEVYAGAGTVSERLLTASQIQGAIVTLNATQLGVPTSNQSTANTNPFWISNAQALTLQVNTITRTAVLNGYTSFGSNFTGGYDVSMITIPAAYVPTSGTKGYVMFQVMLDHPTSGHWDIPQAVTGYFSTGATQVARTILWRFSPAGAIPAGKFAEAFFSTTWMF